MYKDVINTAKDKMEKTKDVLKRELQALRAGRANPQLLDRITVDYYGIQTPLSQMANISAPEPRLLTISLWDTKALPLVEKAILKSDLGLNPTNDGKMIRLAIPELNEERRKEIVKVAKRQSEEARIAVRNVRRDANDQIKSLQKDGKITEDDRDRGLDVVQKTTDEHIAKIDTELKNKEAEVMAV